jgi:hypothetical protein
MYGGRKMSKFPPQPKNMKKWLKAMLAGDEEE